jgi:hypothetical protein
MPDLAIKMRSKEIKQYIEDRKDLFWYSPSPKSETVSDELLVEIILNYGSMDDIRSLFSVMKIDNVARIFFDSINKSERRKANYHKLTINYFTLLFNRYAA